MKFSAFACCDIKVIVFCTTEPVESRCVMDDRSASSDKTSVIFSRLSLQPPSFPRQSSMATNKNLAVHVTPHSTGNAANATYSTIMRDRGMRDHIRFDIRAITSVGVRYLSTRTQRALSVLFWFMLIMV